jgi:hypothetical protein
MEYRHNLRIAARGGSPFRAGRTRFYQGKPAIGSSDKFVPGWGGEWQALGRLRAGFAPQKQCNFFGSGSVYIKGRRKNAECRSGGRTGSAGGRNTTLILWNPYGTPMEYLWNSYGATRVQHASSGLSVPGRDGGVRRVSGVEEPGGQAGGGGGIRWVARARQEGGSEGKGSGQKV